MTNYHHTLLTKINTRQATVAVIGLGPSTSLRTGYVGLPLAVELAKAGFRTLGLDLDPAKVEALNAGRSYIADVPTVEVLSAVKAGTLQATTDYAVLAECDAVSICVPTPLSKTSDPDLSYVVAATEAVADYLHPGLLIVLESTTYPGTTEEIIVPRMFQNGLEVGREVFVAFSPERIDPGRRDYVLRNTPRVIGGVTPACQQLAAALYGCIVEQVVPVSSPAAAEMVKLHSLRSKHFSLGQHRPGQRVPDDVQPTGTGRLGDHRGGRHQALWLHQIHPRAGRGGTLYSLRSPLSGLEDAHPAL